MRFFFQAPDSARLLRARGLLRQLSRFRGQLHGCRKRGGPSLCDRRRRCRRRSCGLVRFGSNQKNPKNVLGNGIGGNGARQAEEGRRRRYQQVLQWDTGCADEGLVRCKRICQ